ncbi:hypothetical protein [Enhygromyxa salina]|uniref:Uncharacterized protein n=1 Tax=Enhygromyxa salina TaxID=215803 RepID=A0A2S9YDM0_9BACT|nr:hypothetical protein [Enhygromyxa salina]PRQ03203.1 hypothetical protein ENSA7_53430 [Enhygromyxa salina]
MRPLWHILERHLEEADFLLEVWTTCLDAPDYTLDELAAGPEARVIAQLNGLAVGGAPIIDELLAPTLEREPLDTSLACAAALALFEIGSVDDCSRVLKVLDRTRPGDERWLGITRGLELSERAGLDQWLIEQLGHGGASPRVAGLATAAAERGVDPGSAIAQLIENQDPHVSSAAVKLACNSSDARYLALVGPLAQAEAPEVQRAALEAGLIRGLRGAWESAIYWAFTERPCPFRRDALSWVAMLGDEGCQRRVLSLLGVEDLARDALWAASFGGHVAVVDAAVALLTDDELGPLAGETLSAVAGAPTNDESLWLPNTPTSHSSELPALEQDLDTDLSEDPEDRIPRPNPEALAAWWTARRNQPLNAPRLLAGQPWSPNGLVAALRAMPLRRRHAHALELRIRSHGAQRINTRSWAALQLDQLASLNPAALTWVGGLPAPRS